MRIFYTANLDDTDRRAIWWWYHGHSGEALQPGKERRVSPSRCPKATQETCRRFLTFCGVDALKGAYEKIAKAQDRFDNRRKQTRAKIIEDDRIIYERLIDMQGGGQCAQ